MNLAGTGHDVPHAGTAAEAEALIAEARARARRRRRRIAVAVVCAAALAAGTLAASGGFSGRGPGARARNGPAGAVTGVTGPPRYFLYAQQSGGAYDWLQIRESASGKVVAQPYPQPPDYLPPYGMAATGPGSFVVGMMTPSDCATQFFRFRLDDRGRPGALTRVGPTLPGELTAMAASAGGGLIGYAIDDTGCKKAGTSLGAYLGVLDVHSGQTRQWTEASGRSQLYMSANGLSSRLSQLSMSANGRLLAFSQATGLPMHGGVEITGVQVRVLPTDAPPGPVAERSRVVARTPVGNSLFSGGAVVLLSPSGTSFYLCSQDSSLPLRGASRITETARITAHQTATGKATGVIAAFTASYVPAKSGVSYYPPALGCSSMALDTSGRFLLVPYLVSYLNPGEDSYSGALLRMAIINTATGARSAWTLPFGKGDAPGSMTIAW
jgi:hypothetical protein